MTEPRSDRTDRLLAACEAYAGEAGAKRLVLGVNTGRRGAYAQLLERGFRVERTGIFTCDPPDLGYDRTDAFVIEDWR